MSALHTEAATAHTRDTSGVLASELQPRRWLAWSGLLVAAYLVVGYFGWRRTLIATEVWALYHAGQSLSEQLQSIRGDLVHPPLMYLLERVWLAVFGQTDSAAKALALVINIPTLILFTWLSTRVTTHWQLASFLFSTIYLRVGNVPNQVRMYGLGLLLAVAAMVLWEKWRAKPTNGKLAAWSLLMILLVYTHLFGALIVFAFVCLNWLYGPRCWAFTFASAVSGVALLPWFFYVIPVYFTRGLHPNLNWVEKNPILGLAEVPYTFMGAPVVSHWTFRVLVVAAVAVHLALLLFAWRAIRRLWPPHRQTGHAAQWLWATVILAGIPILFLFLFSVLVTPAFHARFILGALPAYWLLVLLLAELGWRWGRVLLYAIFVPWVVVIIGLTLAGIRTPFAARQAAVVMASEHRPEDVILCKSVCNTFYWEWTRRLGRAGRIEALSAGAGPTIASVAVLPQTPVENVKLHGATRVWVVFDPGDNTAPQTAFLQRQGFALQKEYPTGRPYLLLLTRPPGLAELP